MRPLQSPCPLFQRQVKAFSNIDELHPRVLEQLSDAIGVLDLLMLRDQQRMKEVGEDGPGAGGRWVGLGTGLGGESSC